MPEEPYPMEDRLIPAHAGKTDPPIDCRSRRTAHPRSRGENLVPAGRMVIGGGSSPLTRGKRPPARGRLRDYRLIPAHAGKTSGARSGLIKAKAHPRSRGENTRVMRAG